MSRAARKFGNLAAAIALTLAVPASAQHSHGVDASEVGSDFVDFQTSCQAEVSDDFNRGVALLHSFWFTEAITQFSQVLQQDADCSVAYWGIMLGHWGNPFAGLRNAQQMSRGMAVLSEARAIPAATDREQAYIDAAAHLFSDADPTTQAQRTLAYESAMAALSADFPDDAEAHTFYALAVTQNADPNDKTYSRQLQAAGILEPLFEQNPYHPGLAHYIIHAYDHPPLADRAISAAERYASLAPDAPHALHMPSHTFTRVGRWQDSVDTNLRSAQAARNNNDVGSELHALDYQAYAYLQMAQDDAAAAVVERALSLLSQVDITAVGATQAGAFSTAAIPARFALERSDWQSAAELPVVSSTLPHTQAMTHFARAVGAARLGQPDAMTDDLETLATLQQQAESRRDSYWAEQIAIQLQAAQAWQTYTRGNRAQAITQMTATADREDATDKAAVTPGPLLPAREMLATMLLESGRAAEALTAFEQTLEKEPNRFRTVYGAAVAAAESGDQARADHYFRQLLDIAANESMRPELAEARAYLAQR